MVCHYPNAIAWSVDEFFRKLLPAVDLSKTLIVYTSDHGQSLQGREKHHIAARRRMSLRPKLMCPFGNYFGAGIRAALRRRRQMTLIGLVISRFFRHCC